jgi:p-cymene monooxygenase electron transfer component
MTFFWKRLFAPAVVRTACIRPFGAEIPVTAPHTLLEAALANDIAFPHSCTVGTCASCKCRLISGSVRAVSDFGYTLSKEELGAGYILACQAVPTSDIVVDVECGDADAPPSERYSGRIRAQTSLTRDICAVSVELDRPMRYVAGQYATLGVGELAPRCYSFSTPSGREGRRDIVFFIRKTPSGAFTEPLFANAFDGVELAVEGPHGNFYLRSGCGHMVCVAGGSGLAPILCLLQEARKKNIRRPCTLLFGARTKQDLYALDEIGELAADWPSAFKFVPVLSDPSTDDWSGERGLVTAPLERLVFGFSGGETAETQAYLCGPPAMIDRAITVLTNAGIGLPSIHYDKFI